MGVEVIIGMAIGVMWTAIIAFVSVGGLRGDFGPVQVQRIFVDPTDMEEWVGQKMLGVFINMVSHVKGASDWSLSESSSDGR